MQKSQVDHTSFYRRLSRGGPRRRRAGARRVHRPGGIRRLGGALACTRTGRGCDGPVNPVYIPRNHLVEEALTAATAGDLAPLELLLEAVRSPFDERAGLERYAEPGPGGVQFLVPNLLWNLTAPRTVADTISSYSQESP